MLPKIEGRGTELAKNVMIWLDNHLMHERITLRSMWEIGTRTPEEIIQSRKIATGFGCLDKAAVIAAILKHNDVESWVVWQRAHHKGKPLGIHFLIEAMDNGKRFTIDPHTTRTNFHEGWSSREEHGNLSQPFKGTTEVVFRKVKRVQVGKDCENKTAFQVTGVNNRRGYFRASNVPLLTYAQFVLSRSNRRNDARIQRINEKRKRRQKQ